MYIKWSHISIFSFLKRLNSKEYNMRNRFLLLMSFLLCFISTTSYAQTQDGAIKGKVTDDKGEAVGGAQVILLLNGVFKAGRETDLTDGTYRFDGLTPGTYDVKVQSVGYAPKMLTGIQVKAEKTIDVNVQINSTVVEVKTVEIVAFRKPLFEKDQTSTGGVIDRKEIERSPYRNMNQMAATVAGAYSQNGGTPNIKGQRSNGTIYFIDGVRVVGNFTVPQSAIDQMSVMTGGVPAEYGDATGGVISITTRGPSRNFSGGLEVLTSQFINPYNYTLVEGNLAGPIYTKNKKSVDSARSILGFFIAGNASRSLDPDPSALKQYKVKDDVLNNIRNRPFRFAPDNVRYVPQAEFIGFNDFEEIKVRPNTEDESYNFSGKLDFQPVENINITGGGQFNYGRRDAYIRQYALFNYENNPEVIDNTYRGYVRFRQNFKSDTGSAIQNAFYSVQFDYTRTGQKVWDKELKDNIFAYGYLGKYEIYRRPFYLREVDTVFVNGEPREQESYYLQGYFPDSITFTPGGINPNTENYTKQLFDDAEQRGMQFRSFDQLRAAGGLLNGDAPQTIYSLWSNTGTRYTQYSKSETDMFNLYFNGGASVKNHHLRFGVQYEQRTSRGYTVTNTAGLWGLMRQLSNRHLQQLDKSNPDPIFREGVFTDTVNYPYQVTSQSTFDRNFRDYLKNNGARDVNGELIGEQTLINVDRYDPGNFKLDMFSPDELLNNGNSFVRSYGYDFYGNKLTSRPGLDDFLDSTKRYVAPYNPIYIAGYIQDKFEFKDITFRVGLRVDRFDANQKVLKDPYSVYETRTVGEINGKDFGGTPFVKPDNIGDDYIPYVNDPFNPAAPPIAFRKDNRWFDSRGEEVTDINVLADKAGGNFAPYLRATKQSEAVLTQGSFVDYEPQVNFMPRVSFSFPISEDAAFFANYDVLTQRPKSGNFSTFDDFYFLQARATNTINNPSLKPEKRINYELGFKQALNKYTALTLTAFYGEIRDLIQLVRINYAYPISYSTFGNLDFGTVKGLTFAYDLRRRASSGVQLQANYTLQFADGTGSEATSGGALINAGQPNLRTPMPLDYDVRHQIVTSLDYRFGVETDYSGPVIGGRKIFEDAGIFLIMSGRSGTPYSRQGNVTQDVAFGIAQRKTLLGEPNSARLPWQFKMDLTVDKNFSLRSKKTQENAGGRSGGNTMLNIYVTIQNVLNTKNVLSVYRYTGTADDDAFISSAEGIKTIENLATEQQQQAYIDQYSVKVSNPDRFAQPRIVRLGLRLNF